MKTSLLVVLVLGAWTATPAQSPALQQYLLLSDTIIGYNADEFRDRLHENLLIQENHIHYRIPVSLGYFAKQESLVVGRPAVGYGQWGSNSYSPRYGTAGGHKQIGSGAQWWIAQPFKVADYIRNNF